ncbi:hypothetical protein PVAND_002789 [Polypedilum vanderplanki]|uniref:Uncharacterized protein n=1 Tax=Polypedilum vanderplanki TaxID=319348 RepID=A0A9J6BTQ0_POLVA|nr:hypothetical protein PVAND_002789 [Polypedilum vanderplanki]
MASDEAWAKLEEMFGTSDRISPNDIYVPPEELDDEQIEIRSRMFKGEEMTRDEMMKLPEKYRELYYLPRDAKLEAPRLAKEYKKKVREERRRKQLEREKVVYERAMRKIIGRIPLSPEEIEIYQKFSSNIYHSTNEKIDINPIDVLNDVIKGDYTLQDVSFGQGTEVKPVEKSPLQLLENIIEDTKRRTQNALHANDSAQFFQSIESDVLSRITPMQLDNIISSCTTGIDLMQETNFDDNEARSACESFLKALAMQEGDTKVKNAIEEAKKRQQNKGIEKLAVVGAVAALLSDDIDEKDEEVKMHTGFDITNTSFDLSFVPSDDPDVYKPLEIISYIGMTK